MLEIVQYESGNGSHTRNDEKMAAERWKTSCRSCRTLSLPGWLKPWIESRGLEQRNELRTELHFLDSSFRNGAKLCWCPWCRSWPSVTSAAERLAVKAHLDDDLIIP